MNKENLFFWTICGIIGIIPIVLIILKLTGIITWSWIIVLIPIWIPILLLVFAIIAFVLTAEDDENYIDE